MGINSKHTVHSASSEKSEMNNSTSVEQQSEKARNITPPVIIRVRPPVIGKTTWSLNPL